MVASIPRNRTFDVLDLLYLLGGLLLEACSYARVNLPVGCPFGVSPDKFEVRSSIGSERMHGVRVMASIQRRITAGLVSALSGFC